MCLVSKAFSWHGLCYIKGVIRKWVILIAMMVSVLPIAARKRKPVVPDSLQRFAISVNGIEFTMQRVEGGSFVMGGTEEQGTDAEMEEQPVHTVTLSDFSIGETEVTQELWVAVMGKNPSRYHGPQLPVESIRYVDCEYFI